MTDTKITGTARAVEALSREELGLRIITTTCAHDSRPGSWCVQVGAPGRRHVVHVFHDGHEVAPEGVRVWARWTTPVPVLLCRRLADRVAETWSVWRAAPEQREQLRRLAAFGGPALPYTDSIGTGSGDAWGVLEVAAALAYAPPRTLRALACDVERDDVADHYSPWILIPAIRLLNGAPRIASRSSVSQAGAALALASALWDNAGFDVPETDRVTQRLLRTPSDTMTVVELLRRAYDWGEDMERAAQTHAAARAAVAADEQDRA